MANRTDKEAKTVKGTNPQFLVEKIIRQRIYDSIYWKEHCFALTAELVVDKAMDLRYVGGIYAGNIKPTPFLCLSLKLLQIQPEKDIAIEFIQQEEFKYIRALGAMYLRLTFESVEIYKYLEPLYNDFRKLRFMNKMGRFEAIYMDEFVDHLLRDERYCDIQLPRLQKRMALEELDVLDTYKSILDEDLDKFSASESEDEDKKKEKPRLTSRRRSRSRDRERDVGDRREERERERAKGRRERGEPEPERSSNTRERDRDRDRERGGERGDRGDRGGDRGDRGGDRGDRADRGGDRGDRGGDRGDRGGDRGDREGDRGDRAGRGGREERGDRDKERDRHDRRDDDRDRDRREKDRGSSKKGKKGDDEREISEMNTLRASLGMAPLQR